MSFEDKYAVSKRGQPAGSFTAKEIIDLLRMKELSTIHKVKVGDDELTVASFIELYETGGLPEQNLGKSPIEEEMEEKEEKKGEEDEAETPPAAAAPTPPPEPGSTDEIHVSRDGQRFGPYLIQEVKDYLKAGNLRFSDLVWYDGVDEWVPLSKVSGIGEGVETLHAVAPPPPKPPPAPAAPPQPPPATGGPPKAGAEVAAHQPVFGGDGNDDENTAALELEREGIAGLGARALALFVDTLLVAAVTSAVVGLVYWLNAMTNPDQSIEAWQKWMVPIVIALVVGWLYSSLTESSGSMATMGKRMVKAQVCLEETGGAMGFGLASGRAFAKIIGVMGFFLIFSSRRRQTLHDMLTGTIVRQTIDSDEHDFDEGFESEDE